MKASMRDNPSFSSILLDRICRSIDDGRTGNEDMKFYSQTRQRTQRMSGFQRDCLVENLTEKKENADKNHGFPEFVRKSHHGHEHEHDHHGVFSSDPSSGRFSVSSSDTETKAPSCFVRPWPRPVKTRALAAAQSDKPLRTEQSAAEKIYGGLKKMKQRQPISPGGRLANFINSLVTTGHAKKPKSSPSTPSLSSTVRHDRNQVPSCSPAALPFSRSYLSKDSPSTREKSRDGAKRTVRLCPEPCGHKETVEQFQTMEKTRRVEEMTREFLKKYHLNQKKNDDHHNDDDVGSCSSSDLFELNHLVPLGNHSRRYEEELPVYETTHVETNRAIVNGLIV